MVAIQVKQHIEETTKKYTHTISDEEAQQQVYLLKALSDPTRLQIINLLLHHEDELCVLEITSAFRLKQPTISFHLRILKDTGIVNVRQRGLYAYYFVNREKLQEAQEVIVQLL